MRAAPSLAIPNRRGFSMGHIHIMSQDVAAAERAFLSFGAPYVHRLGPFDILPFAGAYVLLSVASNSGNSAGSVVSSVSFSVRSMTHTLARCRDVGVQVIEAEGRRSIVTIPGDVLVELLEVPNLDCEAQFCAVTFSTTEMEK